MNILEKVTKQGNSPVIINKKLKYFNLLSKMKYVYFYLNKVNPYY